MPIFRLKTFISIIILIIGLPINTVAIKISNKNIHNLYSVYVKELPLQQISQSNSLKNVTDFYCKLLDAGIDTSLARIVVMVNSTQGTLQKMHPCKNLIKGKSNKTWLWHCFFIYSETIYDFRFSINPCKLTKYFDTIWRSDKNFLAFSIYSIRMKDLINFMDIKTKKNKTYFGYVDVNTDYLISHPQHLSRKKIVK